MRPDKLRDQALRHPLITAYLESLSRELEDSDERQEVLQSIREHIADALAASAMSDERAAVRAVLDDLGPVERIVAAGARPVVSVQGRPWLMIAAATLAVLSLTTVALLPFVTIPVALGTLTLGVVAVARRRRHERAIAWAVVVISGVTLAIALVGALFAVRWAPSGPANEQTGTPTEVPRSVSAQSLS
jgi:hypothetical protein